MHEAAFLSIEPRMFVMKILHVAAALGVAFIPVSALAAHGADEQPRGAGRYEWRSVPQHGPRATGPAQKRIWVTDSPQMANCECPMMKMHPDDCMKDMRRMRMPSSGG